MHQTTAAALVITAAVFLGVRRANAGAVPGADYLSGFMSTFTSGETAEPADDNTDQLATPFEEIFVNLNPTTYIPAAVPADVAAQNERAFLDMLAYAEGTSGPDGYRTMFGHELFDSFADHPRRAVQFRNKLGELLWTSAAGRYQFMAASPLPNGRSTRVDTWGVIQRRLGLPDFGPASQDAAALELIRERGALNDVRAGRLSAAIAKVAPVWASLPGAGHNQLERNYTTLIAQYQAAGGNLEA